MENKYLKKPWIRLYETLALPETFEPYPETSYTEFHLDEPASKYPDSLALVQFDYEMTYRGLKEHVDRLATALADLGIKKGDVVATVLQTSIQFAIADMAIPKIGAIHLLGSVIDSVDGLIDKFTRTECRMVICCHTNVKDRDVIEKVKEAANSTGVEKIIITHTKDYSSNPPEHKDEEEVIWFTDLIKKYPPKPPNVDIDPKRDIAVLSFTGGATGTPKGVMLSHYNSIAHTTSFFGSLLPSSIADLFEGIVRVLMPLPQFHMYGHGMTILMLRHGYALLLVTDPRDMNEFIRLAREYHPLFTVGAPAQYMKLAEKVEDLGLIALSGSMPLAPTTHMHFEENTGSIMVEGYGLAEFSPVTHAPSMVSVFVPLFGNEDNAGEAFHLFNNFLKTIGVSSLIKRILNMVGPDEIGLLSNKIIMFISKNTLVTPSGREKEIMGSIGVPCVDADIKIIDVVTEDEIPMEKVVKERLTGEMCIKAPWRMVGYWPDVGSGTDEEGYVHTGDVVTIDGWGRTYIIDRVKEMVNVSGYKVYPREIDDLLCNYPGVEEIATIGYPDPGRPGSDLLKVFIVPTQDYKGRMKKEDIMDYLRSRTPPYAVPKDIEFRDEFPKTSTNKILKKRLREEEVKKMSSYYTHYSYYSIDKERRK